MRNLVLFLLLTLAQHLAHAADELYGRVVGVTDGDTITVLDAANRQHEVRLFAIDSPETSCHLREPSVRDEQCVERSQPFGKAAKRSLSDLVYGREVWVILRPDTSYGREIGTVWAGQTDVNLQQVARGYAWHYRIYAERGQSADDFARYGEAERRARGAGIGLWADPSSIPPWEYRKVKRQ